MNVVVLVDFENDSVRTSLEVARALGPKLWGVRLDTSERLVDRSLWDELGDFDPRGVNERLVRKVRAALDAEGFDAREDRRLGRLHRRQDPCVRVRRACPRTSTASGRRSCAARTTSRPTSFASREGRSRRSGRAERPNPRLEPVDLSQRGRVVTMAETEYVVETNGLTKRFGDRDGRQRRRPAGPARRRVRLPRPERRRQDDADPDAARPHASRTAAR